MNLPDFSIKNKEVTIITFALMIVLGISAFFTMPQSEDPVLDLPTVGVLAIYPGANPQDIESQVADVIEDAMNELGQVKGIVTNIKDGVAWIEVEFDYGIDTDEKLDEVQRQLNAVKDQMPDGLFSLEAMKFSTTTVWILQLALVSETASYASLKKEAEHIKKGMEQVQGVRKVEIEACPEQELRIALDPVKMTQMNISLSQVEQAIRSNNANIPGGAVKVSNKLFNVKTSGAYDEVKQIENTIVSTYEGRVIYLKNIARIFFGYEDDKWLARYQKERCVFINMQQKEGFNIFSVVDPVKAFLSSRELPPGMKLEFVFDQSLDVDSRVSGFKDNLMQGMVLVGVIIFLVLGIRAASLVMVAIPLSIFIGMAVVSLSGEGIHQISIAGLVVALGMLVDNSIGVVENVERFLEMGYTRREAAIKGTQQLVAPVFAATLTTVLAFIPMIMMPEITGAFIRALPVTVIATLSASFIVATTLTPLIASWILKPGHASQAGTKAQKPVTFRKLHSFAEGPFSRMLDRVFRYKKLTAGLVAVSFLGALMLFPLVGVTFFPTAEKPLFRIMAELPQGNNLDATDEVVRFVEGVLDTIPAVKYYTVNIGHGNPRIYYNMTARDYSPSYAEFLVMLKEYDVEEFYGLFDHLRATFANYSKAEFSIKEFVQGPTSDPPVAVQIVGSDLKKLETYAGEVERIIRQNPHVINVTNPLKNNSTNLFFNINRDKAMMLGVPIHLIDKTIRSYVNGEPVGKFRDRNAEEFDIVMRFDFDKNFRLEDFDKISVPSLSNSYIPLRHVADIEFKEAPSSIDHENGDRVATVEADLKPGVTLDEVLSDIIPKLEKLEWTSGFRYLFKGDVEKRDESFGGMGIASLLALMLILGVLVIQFKSFLQPLIIFTALPLAIIGSVLALFFTGISFSFTAFIGLTSLIGISINNSIVLVDFANELRREGASVEEAARQSAKVRFIPIVMTTLTTILGLLPLTLNGGSLWAPMGWVIIGGLLSSTVLVLLLVPILYQWFTKASKPVNAKGA